MGSGSCEGQLFSPPGESAWPCRGTLGPQGLSPTWLPALCECPCPDGLAITMGTSTGTWTPVQGRAPDPGPGGDSRRQLLGEVLSGPRWMASGAAGTEVECADTCGHLRSWRVEGEEEGEEQLLRDVCGALSGRGAGTPTEAAGDTLVSTCHVWGWW